VQQGNASGDVNSAAFISYFLLTLHSRKIATELMELYWPGITSLCRKLDAFWYENASGRPQMDFGLFYTLVINVDLGKRVKSIPHRDRMNLVFGVCAIMPFGGLSSHGKDCK